MKIASVAFTIMLCILTTDVGETGETNQTGNPMCLIQTTVGNIEVELFQNNAPETVANFIGLAEGTKEFVDAKTREKVKRPFYNDVIFHRVIKDFMLQAGCPLGNGTGGPGYKFADEINASALGLDKIKAIDPKKGPHSFLMIQNQEEYQRNILMPLFQKMNISSQKEMDEKKRS